MESAAASRQPLIIYARVSSVGAREGEAFRSPVQQVERSTAFADSRGYVAGEIVEDLDVSGAVHPAERPGMSHALDEIRAGRAGGLVAYSLDRLSRDPSHGDWLVAEVTSNGGVILAPDLPDDLDSPTGEFQFSVLLGVARLYRRTAGARFRASQESAIRSGIPVGPTPYGYRQKEGSRSIESDPEQAGHVAAMFEARASGMGWPSLARLMTERTGRQFTAGSMAGRIGNPLYYTGRIHYNGLVSDHDAGAIVDSATWHSAQHPNPPRRPKRPGTWLLTGLLVCDECGRNLRPWRPSARQKSAYRYRCDGHDCPSRVSVHGPVVEGLVTEAAFQADLRLTEKPDAGPDLDQLESDLAGAEQRFEAIQTAEVQDAMGDAWPAALRDRRADRDQAAAALVEGRQLAGTSRSGRTYRLGHIYEDLDPAARREALAWVFREVRVHKVARGQEPELTYIPRDTVPYGASLLYQPAEIEIQSD